MSNIPQGTEHDPAAPWNDKPVACRYIAHYILTEQDGLDVQYEVNLPECCDSYDRWKLSRAWCRDNGFKFIDQSQIAFTGCISISEGECYE